MFILSNIIFLLFVAVLVFIMFTFLNILSFTKDFSTSIFLTLIFFELFLITPFKTINSMYHNRDKTLRKIVKKEKLSEEQEKELKHLFQKKRRIFVSLYKSGFFSYSDLMNIMHGWYESKPFTVRFRVLHMNRRKFQDKYINVIKREFPNIATT